MDLANREDILGHGNNNGACMEKSRTQDAVLVNIPCGQLVGGRLQGDWWGA